jgi:hypothetical protein
MIDKYDEIVIHWSAKYKLNESDKLDLFKENVLYQIYGDSHIYGRDTLLYIGKTDRAIGVRLSEHLKSFFKFANNLSVSVGQLEIPLKNLEVPESILIANHKPSFNKEYIHDISTEAKSYKIIIINNGDNYMLKTCCTNYWWV